MRLHAMNRRRFGIGLAAMLPLPAVLRAQDSVFSCPMDPDVRSNQPGVCKRCGMKLVAGVPDQVEYHLDLTTTPRAVKPGEPVRLEFAVHDPYKDRQVTNFQLVHEKLYHMYVVSQDMKFFVHDHPVYQPDGSFYYTIQFPHGGMYRILSDFYPDGATPQLIAKTVLVPGSAPPPIQISKDYSEKKSENTQVQFWTDPAEPIAGFTTQLHFKLDPGEEYQQWLGAWGHMLVASDDLVDMIHTHPFIADGSPHVQFDVTFPRTRGYRVWMQFQRAGVINTVHFDVPVADLK